MWNRQRGVFFRVYRKKTKIVLVFSVPDPAGGAYGDDDEIAYFTVRWKTRELVLSTAPKTWDNTDKDSKNRKRIRISRGSQCEKVSPVLPLTPCSVERGTGSLAPLHSSPITWRQTRCLGSCPPRTKSWRRHWINGPYTDRMTLSIYSGSVLERRQLHSRHVKECIVAMSNYWTASSITL